ncbi:hypothetical protein GTP41_01815 [Pseudoduganella sp. DS3]|uniref:Uncharacterized protein n=1 Tax=Pseudoduganella guangdongensis TaxID=2692179 RepID=A0A6N9HC69_9BURK|nr:hypothetical protein [Pseudoduganella guangdongensis]MYN00827.1 hypothetical protein [Pseudoduganella guangdongensis]
MLATELEKSLRQSLRSAGQQLKDLDALGALRFVTEHWQSTEVDGLRPMQGDGLVAYFELLNRGRGSVLEFGINRILRFPPIDGANFWEWAPGYKLRLSLTYKPPLEFFQLNAAKSVVDCWSKADVLTFIDELKSLPLFKLVNQLELDASSISFTECDSPPTEANHATKGLTWAKA